MKPSPEASHPMQVDFEQDRSSLAPVRRLSVNWPTLAGALFIALLILGFYTWQIHREQAGLRAQMKALQADIIGLQAQVTELHILNDEIGQLLLEGGTLFTNSMRVIALEGTEDAPTARGTFYAGDATGVLVLQDLPPLTQDEVYQIWLIPSDGSPIAAGLVRVEAEGATTVNIDMDGKSQEFAAVGVSTEPAGGSPQPTGPVVLLGTVNVGSGR